MSDRSDIEPITDEHKALKHRATQLLHSDVVPTSYDAVTNIYSDFTKITVDMNVFLPIISIVGKMVKIIAEVSLGKKHTECVEKLDIFILDNSTIWVELYIKDDRVTKARFFGRKYSHISAIRTMLTAYSGRTGLYVALGANS